MWELARCCAAAPGQIRETPSSAPMTDEWVSLCRTPQTVCSGYPSGHSAAPLFDINSLTSCHYAAPADMTSVQLVWVWLWQAWDFYGTQMISWLWNDEHSAAKYSLSEFTMFTITFCQLTGISTWLPGSPLVYKKTIQQSAAPAGSRCLSKMCGDSHQHSCGAGDRNTMGRKQWKRDSLRMFLFAEVHLLQCSMLECVMSSLPLIWTVMQPFLCSWVDLLLSFVINVSKALTRQQICDTTRSLSFSVLFLWPGQSPMNGFLWWRQNKSSSPSGTSPPLFLQQRLFIETKTLGRTREVV